MEIGVIPPGTALSPRPIWVRPWAELSSAEQKVAARFMECFAGFLSHTDAEIGRLVAFLEDLGELENTLIVLVSDNGASSEGGSEGSLNDIRLSNMDPAGIEEMQDKIDQIGGPLTHNNYPWGWTMAGNTPFKRWKREVHEGGVADPCIVHWPKGGIDPGSVRRQFVHAIDVFPSVLEIIGLDPPEAIDSVEQSHIDGVSFSYLLGPDGGSEQGRHVTQHFEMFGSRAIYHQGWKAVTFHPVGPLYPDGLNPNAPFDDDVWELYQVEEDVSETKNVAQEHPDRLQELIDLWWTEAERNQVLPLDNRILWALVNPKPDARRDRSRFRYFQDGAQVPESVAVNVRNRSHALTVDISISDGVVPEGTLLALGSALGGWSLQFRDGRPRYVHNLYGKELHVIASDDGVGPGRHTIEYAFTKDDGLGGAGTLRCDGHLVAEGVISHFTPQAFNGVGVGLTCGYEWGPAVGNDYAAPDRFNGTILRALVETRGPIVRDPMAEIEAILAQQ
jgi:hypothetical protein